MHEGVAELVLVTGATGYIGEQLVRHLVAEGPRVRILVRRRAKAEAVFGPLLEHLEVAEGDLGDRESLERAVRGVRQVYHAASLVRFAGDWAQFEAANVTGAVNLLDACLAAGVERVVHLSSIAAGGPAVMEGGRLRPRTEADLPAPLPDPYGRSKLAQEQAALSYNQRGLPVVVVRPSAVFGPGDLEGMNQLLQLVARGRLPFYLGSRRGYVNVVYAADLVRGCLFAMERGRSGEIYNLVGPHLTHEALFQILADVTGGRAPWFDLPTGVLLALASLISWASLGRASLHPDVVRNWTAPWMASGVKAQDELGLQSTDLNQAWAKTWAWLRTAQAGNLHQDANC